jgi:hypothetical protein
MAKKQKRSIPSTRPSTSAGPVVSERPSVSPTPYAAPRTPTFSTTRTSYSQEFNPDYSLVVHDLKKIGIMAGTFTAILVILSFFLR